MLSTIQYFDLLLGDLILSHRHLSVIKRMMRGIEYSKRSIFWFSFSWLMIGMMAVFSRPNALKFSQKSSLFQSCRDRWHTGSEFCPGEVRGHSTTHIVTRFPVLISVSSRITPNNSRITPNSEPHTIDLHKDKFRAVCTSMVAHPLFIHDDGGATNDGMRFD